MRGRGIPGPGLFRLEYDRPGDHFSRVIALQEWYTASSRYAFVVRGNEQPWEDPTHYRNRLKRDRFTPEILSSYCRKLGVDVLDLDFYSGPSVFCERKLPAKAKADDAAPRRRFRLPWSKQGPPSR
jgi:hypothetical protein